MDFSTLLGLAQENQGLSKVKPARSFSTKVEAAKKNPRQKKLSENVRKFVERQKAEDAAKRHQAAKDTAKLLEMRRGDKKSTRTMNSMLQRTKSANRAVIAEAVNRRDTADTLAGGRNQCDEDDYGYESAAAKKLFEKMMTTYEKDPSDPMDKFTKSGNLRKGKNLSSTVARVKHSLDSEEAEANGPRRKKSKHSSSSTASATATSSSTSSSSSLGLGKDDKTGTKGKRSAEEEARRRRLELAKKAPPPVAFSDLMKMASQKSQEPIKIEKKVKEVAEFGRPMSAKQKEEYIRERNSHLRKIGKLPPEPKSGDKVAFKKPHPATGGQISSKDGSSSGNKEAKKNNNNPPPPPEKKKPVIQGPEFHPAVLKSKKQEEARAAAAAKLKAKSKPQPGSSKEGRRRREDDYEEEERSRSPSPIRGGSRSKAFNRIDSESEEEDSDMDDFIDDSDCKMDVSSEIQKMFGYNRHSFRDEPDFDDRSMENNRFSDVMKEEARSARIGLQEDLEDMRMEEEEKRRKKMMKKRR